MKAKFIISQSVLHKSNSTSGRMGIILFPTKIQPLNRNLFINSCVTFPSSIIIIMITTLFIITIHIVMWVYFIKRGKVFRTSKEYNHHGDRTVQSYYFSCLKCLFYWAVVMSNHHHCNHQNILMWIPSDVKRGKGINFKNSQILFPKLISYYFSWRTGYMMYDRWTVTKTHQPSQASSSSSCYFSWLFWQQFMSRRRIRVLQGFRTGG